MALQKSFTEAKSWTLSPLLVFKYRLLWRAGLTLDDLAHYTERRIWLATLQSTRKEHLGPKVGGGEYIK